MTHGLDRRQTRPERQRPNPSMGSVKATKQKQPEKAGTTLRMFGRLEVAHEVFVPRGATELLSRTEHGWFYDCLRLDSWHLSCST